MHVCMYGACIYDAIFFGNGRTDGRTNTAILGVGYIKEISRKDQRNIKEISKKNEGVAVESTKRVNIDQLQGAAKEKSWQGDT